MNSHKIKQLKLRDVDGLLLLNKPIGLTSNAALQIVKKLYQAKKAGHTGSLDPLATGMLPICFGEATKFSQFLLDADKHYTVTAKLGIRTSTDDAEGEILEQKPIKNISVKTVLKALEKFRGQILQIPSMYSALKHNGQPLYKLARQGIEITREARPIIIHQLDLITLHDDILELDVICSKGTYIRTLIADIGQELNCGAHVTALCRESVSPFHKNQMISLETIQALVETSYQNVSPEIANKDDERDNNNAGFFQKKDVPDLKVIDKLLLPIESGLDNYPTLHLTENAIFYLVQGQSILVPNSPKNGLVKLTSKNGNFIGVGEMLSNGKVAPKRLLRTNAKIS